jgi:hypothetical protein
LPAKCRDGTGKFASERREAEGVAAGQSENECEQRLGYVSTENVVSRVIWQRVVRLTI